MSNVVRAMSSTSSSFGVLAVIVERRPGDVQREDPTGLSDSMYHRTLRADAGDVRPGLWTDSDQEQYKTTCSR